MPGRKPPTTGRSTPRPARPRLSGGRRPPRPSGPSPSRACCGRRSRGPSGARPTRRPWSGCTATPTRSTRGWPGGQSSCCSPRSTWTGSRSASAGSPPGPPSRSPSAGTATPRPASPAPSPAPSPPPPGSTISPPSATATTRPRATRSPTSSSSTAPGTNRASRGNRNRRKGIKEAAVADSPRETLALARAAAGAVRSLNHATLGSGGLAQPADAYELIGELSLAAAGLPQLLAQVGRWLASALEAGRLGCDDGADPGAAVGGARLSLSGARASAAALARDLGQAQQQLAAVHGGPAPEEEGGESS